MRRDGSSKSRCSNYCTVALFSRCASHDLTLTRNVSNLLIPSHATSSSRATSISFLWVKSISDYIKNGTVLRPTCAVLVFCRVLCRSLNEIEKGFVPLRLNITCAKLAPNLRQLAPKRNSEQVTQVQGRNTRWLH